MFEDLKIYITSTILRRTEPEGHHRDGTGGWSCGILQGSGKHGTRPDARPGKLHNLCPN